MTPDPKTVELCAKGLTKAQREAVIDAADGYLKLKHMLSTIVPELAKRGIMLPRVRGLDQDNRLTGFGLAVRQALLTSPHGEGV